MTFVVLLGREYLVINKINCSSKIRPNLLKVWFRYLYLDVCCQSGAVTTRKPLEHEMMER